MAGKTPPPLRNYAQMARVVRDAQKSRFAPSVPYQLGKAYGSAAASAGRTRVRTLDEIGINSRPPNQLQPPETDSYYSRRESTASYSQIWCMANQAASCSTLIPSLNFTPSMTSANRL